MRGNEWTQGSLEEASCAGRTRPALARVGRVARWPVLVAVLGVLSGCGGGHHRSSVVARVGGVEISESSVAHWAGLIERGAVVSETSVGSLPQQALATLIAARWLLGEASRVGERLSAESLDRLVGEARQEAPGGSGEFDAQLSAGGETVADLRLVVAARWAASVLAERLAAGAARIAREHVGERLVAQTYKRTIERYRVPERRRYDLIERIPSREAALKLARRLGTGARFSAASVEELPFRPRRFEAPNGKGAVYRAVFSARLGVLVGPLPLDHRWCLFVLRRIEPAHVEPFAQVRGAIERHLYAMRIHAARVGLLLDYTRRWTEMTDCGPGWVVQKCREFTGARTPETEPFAVY